MNLKELKEICKNNNIKNYSKLNKNELIKLINKNLKVGNNPQEINDKSRYAITSMNNIKNNLNFSNIFEYNNIIYNKSTKTPLGEGSFGTVYSYNELTNNNKKKSIAVKEFYFNTKNEIKKLNALLDYLKEVFIIKYIKKIGNGKFPEYLVNTSYKNKKIIMNKKNGNLSNIIKYPEYKDYKEYHEKIIDNLIDLIENYDLYFFDYKLENILYQENNGK